MSVVRDTLAFSVSAVVRVVRDGVSRPGRAHGVRAAEGPLRSSRDRG